MNEVGIIAPHQLFEFGCGHTSEAMCCKCADRQKAESGTHLETRIVDKIKGMEIAVNELADRLAKTEERLAALELRPQPCPYVQPYPYPQHPGWITPPGYVSPTPYWVSPVYVATTKEST